VERVTDYIHQKQIQAEIRILDPGATKTSASAAQSLGCTIAEIAKTIGLLKLIPEEQREAVLVILSGDKLVSLSKLSEQLNAEFRKMNAEEVKDVTGYPIGGVPPFPHVQNVLVVADESLFRFEKVWAAAGAPNAVVRISPEILFHLGISKVNVSE
jgi:prolyl-tRNA editing enzyme YbaK/EbsC (Cys-tRNA(Pro) deacylase)